MTGAVIPGAKVAIRNVETGQERVVTTNAEGSIARRFTLFGAYELPWYKDRSDFAGQLLGGWNVSMVAKFAAGTTFTVISSNGFGDFKTLFEGHSLILRADLLNAFNHVQYGFPILDLANANFGRLTGTAVSYSPRNVQISLRYVF